jgi:hypothetical protein
MLCHETLDHLSLSSVFFQNQNTSHKKQLCFICYFKGLNDNQLALAAKKIADYLAAHEEPQNEEQYLLHELWKVGNEEEQHHLAHMLVKLVKE